MLEFRTCHYLQLESVVRVSKGLIHGRLSGLPQGVLVQDGVGGVGAVGVLVQAALGEEVLGVEHLEHGDAVAEALVHGGEHWNENWV